MYLWKLRYRSRVAGIGCRDFDSFLRLGYGKQAA
jgi:hypothetical protein